jgi:nicotinate-nucleotide--dimethylbenzimidazole phosphoribosyltransferase
VIQLHDDPTNDWARIPAAAPGEAAQAAALARQSRFTKPPRAPGSLEGLAIRLAALQGVEHLRVDRVQICVFIGDHGVAAEDGSAFPALARRGAAIRVLARELGAALEIINLGTRFDTGVPEGTKHYSLGSGTADFTESPAMDEHQLACAIGAGRHAAERTRLAGRDLFIGGEIGISNIASATALACF